MRSLLKKIFRFTKKHIALILSIAILAVSVALMVTKYFGSLERLFSSVCDFGTAVAFYFVFVFERPIERYFGSAPEIKSGVTEIPNVDLQKYIWFNIDDLIRKVETYEEALFQMPLIVEYNYYLFDLLYKISYSSLLLLPCFIIFFVVIKQSALKENDLPPGEASQPYYYFCVFLEKIFKPAFKWLRSFLLYFWNKPVFKYIFCSTWVVSLNVVTIVIGAVAYYFYFVASFDFFSMGNQIVKLLIDLIMMLWGAPALFWIVAALSLTVYIMLKAGYRKLKHMEAKNCGFLKTTDYLILVKGPPGAGKTTLATDMALSWVNIHKTDSLQIMMAMEMLFPAFSFQSLRRALNEAIDSREIFCIPACDIFADKLLVESPAPYLYNTKIFATERNTGTSNVTLETAIRTYSKAYFIYQNDNSVMSNYPIRFDGKFDKSKHLKKWDGDFFKRNAITAKEISRYARILDQDVLRMCKKIDPANRFNGTFGYGIYVNTEWGKSRGNQLTTEDVKKQDKKTNQKNDLYSYALKMCRHACSTVWHNVFFRFIGDEQRPESLSADQRQLCSILGIEDKSELKLVLPFGALIDKTYSMIYEPFVKFYTDFLNVRSDVILSVMLLKFAVAAFSRLYSYIYNTFGYYELDLSMEKGAEYGDPNRKGEIKLHKYYLMCKKVYADRYNTDCHSSYFTKMQLEAEIGMIDYPTYQGRRMSIDEMRAQHDYFIMEWLEIMDMADKYRVPVGVKQTEAENNTDDDIFEF